MKMQSRPRISERNGQSSGGKSFADLGTGLQRYISICKILGYEIQDVSTSIWINLKFEQPLLEKMVMKVTNIYKHEIVDTRA